MSFSRKDCEEVLAALKSKALGYRYQDLERWLRRADCRLVSESPSGSHRVWRHPSGRRIQLKTRGQRELLPAYVKAVAKALAEEERCLDTR
jgi:hypothetical protein